MLYLVAGKLELAVKPPFGYRFPSKWEQSQNPIFPMPHFPGHFQIVTYMTKLSKKVKYNCNEILKSIAFFLEIV